MSADAREEILESIRKGRRAPRPAPAYAFAPWTGDVTARFCEKALTSVAAIHRLAGADEAPERIAALLAEANAPLKLHIPMGSALNNLSWHRAPQLSIVHEAPSGSDAAFAMADHAVAETGTLVFLSGPNRPSSWHFRPGREIVLVHRESIVPRLEDVIKLLTTHRPLPATVNLITGPSRTADIEQTIELGAHGPRALHILIAG